MPTNNEWALSHLITEMKLAVGSGKINSDLTFPSEELIPPGGLQCPLQGDGEVCLTSLAIKGLEDVMDKKDSGSQTESQRRTKGDNAAVVHCPGLERLMKTDHGGKDLKRDQKTQISLGTPRLPWESLSVPTPISTTLPATPNVFNNNNTLLYGQSTFLYP